jgi:predicted transcriptional regulator
LEQALNTGFSKNHMLEQLFGSNTRSRLLNLFLRNPDKSFFVRELTRRIKSQINSVRRELNNLESMGLLTSYAEDGGESGRKRLKKFYKVDTDFVLYQELRALILKSQLLLQRDLKRKISDAGTVSYLALTGSFLGRQDMPVDMFIVGRINSDKLSRLIKRFEKSLGTEINYSVMTVKEFNYRRQITDKFLFSILESPKIVLMDKIDNNYG